MIPVSQGKPYAGNPHVRFEEGASAQAAPRRSALLHTRNRESVRRKVGTKGAPDGESLPYKQVSRSVSEPLLLTLVKSRTPCVQRIISRESEKKRRSRFAVRKAECAVTKRSAGRRRRSRSDAQVPVQGLRAWKVTLGIIREVCGVKASAEIGRGRSGDEAGQRPLSEKGLYLQNETMRIEGREEKVMAEGPSKGDGLLGCGATETAWLLLRGASGRINAKLLERKKGNETNAANLRLILPPPGDIPNAALSAEDKALDVA